MDARPAEQGVDAALQVAGRLDGDLHQALGGAVHQPAAVPALVHADRAADPGLRSADGTDGFPWYVQLERAHPDPDLAGVQLHARDARARAEQRRIQPAGNPAPEGLAVGDLEPLRAGWRRGGLALGDDGAPGGGVRFARLSHALAGRGTDLVVRHRVLDPVTLSRRLATVAEHDGSRNDAHARAVPLLSFAATPAPGWPSWDPAGVAAVPEDTPNYDGALTGAFPFRRRAPGLGRIGRGPEASV